MRRSIRKPIGDTLLAFIHIAKTAGQTVETMLQSSFGAAYSRGVHMSAPDPFQARRRDYVVPKFNADDFRQLQKYCPFLKCVGGHSVALWSGIDEIRPTRYFTFLRDPIRRGASHFQYHVQTDQPDLTWEQWCENTVHHNHQVKMLSAVGDVEDAIAAVRKKKVFTGLMECFDESLLVLRKVMAPDLNISYVRRNTARGNSLAQQILDDPAKVADIRSMYADEFALYEFVRDQWYPQYREQYGPGLEQDLEAFQAGRGYRLNRFNILLNRLYSRLVLAPASSSYRQRMVR
jgi:hypothetical protein